MNGFPWVTVFVTLIAILVAFVAGRWWLDRKNRRPSSFSQNMVESALCAQESAQSAHVISTPVCAALKPERIVDPKLKEAFATESRAQADVLRTAAAFKERRRRGLQ